MTPAAKLFRRCKTRRSPGCSSRETPTAGRVLHALPLGAEFLVEIFYEEVGEVVEGDQLNAVVYVDVTSAREIGVVAGRTEQEREAVVARLTMVEAEGPVGAARKNVERWYSDEDRRSHTQVRTASWPQRISLKIYTRIKAPMLAMIGEFDVGSPPRMSQEMGRRTGGRVVVLPGSRHDVLDECLELIAKEIAAHVR